MVESINMAEIRLEEQSEKAESCRENLWNEIQLKWHKDGNRHKNRMKRNSQDRLVYVKTYAATSPLHEVEPAGTLTVRQKLGTNKLTRADW